jgi:hypothetical protein
MKKDTQLKQLFFWIMMLILPFLLQAKPYISNNDTVTDIKTNLQWIKSWNSDWNTNRFDWNGALNYCENLVFAGQSDWRLPNIKELSSIIDRTHVNPAIDTEAFDQARGDARYWSSTPGGWIVGLAEGEVTVHSTNEEIFAKCVRNCWLPGTVKCY